LYAFVLQTAGFRIWTGIRNLEGGRRSFVAAGIIERELAQRAAFA
jgi:hypothetical protein